MICAKSQESFVKIGRDPSWLKAVSSHESSTACLHMSTAYFVAFVPTIKEAAQGPPVYPPLVD